MEWYKISVDFILAPEYWSDVEYVEAAWNILSAQ